MIGCTHRRSAAILIASRTVTSSPPATAIVAGSARASASAKSDLKSFDSHATTLSTWLLDAIGKKLGTHHVRRVAQDHHR